MVHYCEVGTASVVLPALAKFRWQSSSVGDVCIVDIDQRDLYPLSTQLINLCRQIPLEGCDRLGRDS